MQLEKWHAEKKDTPKFYLLAKEKLNNPNDPSWFILKHCVHRSRVLELLFFNRPEEWKLDLEKTNQITEQRIVPFLDDIREVYHLLHWVNRDAFVLGPWVVSLNRLIELTNQWQIQNAEIVKKLTELAMKPFELIHPWNGDVLSMHGTFEEAQVELCKKKELSKFRADFSCYRSMKVTKRNDDEPFDAEFNCHVALLQKMEKEQEKS